MDVDRDFLAFLGGYVTEHKRRRMDEVLAQRTRRVTVVLEDIVKPHNASAVVRTCDCFGVQDLHIVENRYDYDVNPCVTRGASKWIDLLRYRQEGRNNTEICYEHLRSQGYRIYATSPHADSTDLCSIDVTDKVALVFGNELEGVSDYAMAQADCTVAIPMYGFTESFNLSVSAAICLYELSQRLRDSTVEWQLSDAEKDELKLKWYRQIVSNADAMERLFHERQPEPTS